MKALESFLEDIISGLQNPNTDFKERLSYSLKNISRKISSTVIQAYLNGLSDLCVAHPQKAVMNLEAFCRFLQAGKFVEVPARVFDKRTCEISIENSSNGRCQTVKVFPNSEAVFFFGGTILVLTYENRRIDKVRHPLDNRDYWKLIKVKEASEGPSRICANSSVNTLKAGEFYKVNENILEIKEIGKDFMEVGIRNREFEECTKILREESNCFGLRQGKIVTLSPNLSGTIRIVRYEADWLLCVTNVNYLKFLGNPVYNDGNREFLELPFGVSEIWINEQKYNILIRE